MSVIIIPEHLREPTEHERQVADQYANEPEVRRLADEIHERSMLPPPTCSSCIELAIIKLKSIKDS